MAIEDYGFPADTDDDPLSFIVLGTKRSPGVCKIENHERKKGWDVKAAKGQTGASSTLNGDPLGEFDVTFMLADDADWVAWLSFQILIESTTNGPTPVALPIYHPDLALQRFTEVVNRGIGGVQHDGRGGRVVKVKFGEHRPPKPKAPKKAKAKPDAGGAGGAPVKPDPNAAAKAQLEALLAEARKP